MQQKTLPYDCGGQSASVWVAAHPAWREVPDYIDTSHIYTDRPEMGWSFYSSNMSTVTTASTIFTQYSTTSVTPQNNAIGLEEVQGRGVDSSTALCITNFTQVQNP